MSVRAQRGMPCPTPKRALLLFGAAASLASVVAAERPNAIIFLADDMGDGDKIELRRRWR